MTFSVTKDPAEVLDYSIDYTAVFAAVFPVDTILSSNWATTGSGVGTLTIDTNSHDGTIATVWLSAGRAGAVYNVTNTVVTNSTPARTYERTIRVKCVEK